MPQPAYAVPARIETERLVLRKYDAADAEQLAPAVTRNIPHLERYMEWIKFEPQTVEQRREFIAGSHRQFDAGEEYTFGMFSGDGRMLGGTGYHVLTNPDRLEIGYWIGAEHEGNGFVTEASAALTRVALEIAGAEIVDIAHAPSNERSAAVPARLGYTRQEATGHEAFDSGSKVPVVMWWARAADLANEPLASVPRPACFDAAGNELPWPA